MKKRSRIFIPILFCIAIVVLIIIASSIGVVSIPVEDVVSIILSKIGWTLNSSFPQHVELTVLELRLPRILISLFAGASLAICGCVFQSIFRNPICDPYILGISSGASLGAAVAFILGWDLFFFGVTFPALVTALATLIVIVAIARFGSKQSTYTLLLTGIAINFLISAVITLLMVTNQQSMQKIIFWTMGSFATVSWNDFLLLLPIMSCIVFLLFFYAKDLNIIQLGSETAKSLGVNTQKTTIITLSLASLLIASVVSICGVIGFIGLIVPHMVRIMVGNNTRAVFVYSLFTGAVFMLIADTIARTVAIPSELPVGSITAIAGAPYFIFLLLRNKKIYTV